MIAPNQFEAEQLSKIKILNENDVKQSMNKLLDMGPKIVVITSTEFVSKEGYITL